VATAQRGLFSVLAVVAQPDFFILQNILLLTLQLQEPISLY